jgi:hypothetical protein
MFSTARLSSRPEHRIRRLGDGYPAVMDRRWAGIVLLVAAVAAAVVVGSLRSKQIAGSAAPAPISEPPAVGDCLGQLSGYGYPEVAPVVPCDQPHFAEVAAVMPRALPEVASAESFDDPNSPNNACPRQTSRYLGLGGEASTSESEWQPTATVGAVLIGPSELQRKMGSAWVVCAVAVGGADLPLQGYQGTLRDAAATGHYPSILATCPVSPEQLSLNQNCDYPHDMESFGYRSAKKKIGDITAATTSCAELVKRATGLSDPTAGGRMTVVVLPDETAQSYSVETPEAAGDVTIYRLTPGYGYFCLVRATGQHDLTGPLLGLQGGPIPLK